MFETHHTFLRSDYWTQFFSFLNDTAPSCNIQVSLKWCKINKFWLLVSFEPIDWQSIRVSDFTIKSHQFLAHFK